MIIYLNKGVAATNTIKYKSTCFALRTIKIVTFHILKKCLLNDMCSYNVSSPDFFTTEQDIFCSYSWAPIVELIIVQNYIQYIH